METTSSADTVTDVAVDTDEPVTDDAAAAPPAATKKKRNSLIEWGVVIVIAALSAFLVRTFVVEQFKVVDQSMESTLHGGHRVLVNKLGYRLHDPRRGDVVVLDPIEGISSSDLIKRVIGLPGETVSMSAETCQVLVNGKELIEPYLDPIATTPGGCGGELKEVTVPADHVLVLGDHRNASSDGRNFGPVAFDHIVGRAFVVIWPKSDWQWL